MKTPIICAVLSILAVSASAEGIVDAEREISVGDPAGVVRSVLGEPHGYLGCAGHEVLVYPRGKVEIRDGKVIDVDLVSAAEAERRRLELERRRAARAAEQAAEKEKLRIEGLAVKDETLSDPEFSTLAPVVQLAFWHEFARTYPDVPADLELAKALAMVREERERVENEQRMLAMERRVAAAERQAERAEREAMQARRERRRCDAWYIPPFISYYPYSSGKWRDKDRKEHPHDSKKRPAREESEASLEKVYGFRERYSTMPGRVDQTTRDIELLRSGPHSPPPSPNSIFSVPYSFGGGSVDPSRDPALYHTYAGGDWTVYRDR